MCDNKEEILYYNTHVMAFTVAAKIDMDNRTNGVTVKNAGNTLLIFDDETLQPGESKAIGGNRKELFIGRKDLYFQLPTPPPATPVNLAFVTVKFYVPLDPESPGYIKDL